MRPPASFTVSVLESALESLFDIGKRLFEEIHDAVFTVLLLRAALNTTLIVIARA